MANEGLDKLIFYAIDKASPYALAAFPGTDSLDKILDYSLARLSIPAPGIASMWLWINAHSAQFGAKPVSPSMASEVETVKDVKLAVYMTIPSA